MKRFKKLNYFSLSWKYNQKWNVSKGGTLCVKGIKLSVVAALSLGIAWGCGGDQNPKLQVLQMRLKSRFSSQMKQLRERLGNKLLIIQQIKENEI